MYVFVIDIWKGSTLVLKPRWFGKTATGKPFSREMAYGLFPLALVSLVPEEEWILRGGSARGWI